MDDIYHCQKNLSIHISVQYYIKIKKLTFIFDTITFTFDTLNLYFIHKNLQIN